MVLTGDPKVAFKDANWALLVGSKPRGPGMERADLLKDNGKIFVAQGKAIDEVAADDARVAVVGNPCNTNCMIAAAQAKRLAQGALHRDGPSGPEPRPRAARAEGRRRGRATWPTSIIYGNHSPTMFADFTHAKIGGKPAREVIGDDAWLKNEFLPTVGKRGAAIIAARGLSSAASAANAADRPRPRPATPRRRIHSVAVAQPTGSYGFDEGVWAAVPVQHHRARAYEVVREG